MNNTIRRPLRSFSLFSRTLQLTNPSRKLFLQEKIVSSNPQTAFDCNYCLSAAPPTTSAKRHFVSNSIVTSLSDVILAGERGHDNDTFKRNGSNSALSESASLATPSFLLLVERLKSNKQTCTVVESSCGGLISASLMSVPGSSRIYFGGTVAYSTKHSGKLLCGDEELHRRLLSTSPENKLTDSDSQNLLIDPMLSEDTKKYIQSKIQWTREAALSYCRHLDTDFAIAEGGATGPTFRPDGMKAGFAVLAVAGRRKGSDQIEILAQRVVYSDSADREDNMRLFADSAADLCGEVLNAGSEVTADGKAISTKHAQMDELGALQDLFFDRSSGIRHNSDILKDFYQRPDAMHVVVRGTTELLFASSRELALAPYEDLCGTYPATFFEGRTFLGRLGPEQTPLFALFLPADAAAPNEKGYFANTRTRAPMLTPLHNELALTATAYINWQKSHKYCNVCGAPLELIYGGTCSKCTNTNGETHFHWPRQDPSIIVLVTNPSSTHALLARSPRHPPYLYTALAGFVEAGENMESAVAREVYEESGVTVDGNSVEYVGSQSWPFPRSCMIGFHAKTHSRRNDNGLAMINIDPDELVDAKWFEKVCFFRLI
ncbi:hypothetical protein ACHAXS_008454 [Conticribra weissflogii]